MTTRPKKALEDYIYQGNIIQNADDNALAEGYVWAFVPAIRTELNDTLAALIAKHEEVAAAYPNYDQIIDEKKAARIAAEDGLDKITVYIKTAFRADSEVLLNNLRIDRPFPTDDEKIMIYLMDFLSQYDNHDQITYPIPPAYNDPAIANATEFIAKHELATDIFEDRRTAIQDRGHALDAFVQILIPIKTWLHEMLPDGNEDTRLIEYGFTPYGTHETPEEPEQLPTPENFGLEFTDPNLRLYWDAVEGATGYVLKEGTNPMILARTIYEGPDTEFKYDPPGGHLYFRVWAMKGEEWGARGEAIDIEIVGVRPGAPKNLVLNYDGTYVRASWEEPDTGVPEYFRLYAATVPMGSIAPVRPAEPDVDEIITLEVGIFAPPPGSTVYIWVSAFHDGEEGDSVGPEGINII